LTYILLANFPQAKKTLDWMYSSAAGNAFRLSRDGLRFGFLALKSKLIGN